MPSKKPPAPKTTPAGVSTKPPSRQHGSPSTSNARAHPGNRWQRSKRYGWDSR